MNNYQLRLEGALLAGKDQPNDAEALRWANEWISEALVEGDIEDEAPVELLCGDRVVGGYEKPN